MFTNAQRAFSIDSCQTNAVKTCILQGSETNETRFLQNKRSSHHRTIGEISFQSKQWIGCHPKDCVAYGAKFVKCTRLKTFCLRLYIYIISFAPLSTMAHFKGKKSSFFSKLTFGKKINGRTWRKTQKNV